MSGLGGDVQPGDGGHVDQRARALRCRVVARLATSIAASAGKLRITAVSNCLPLVRFYGRSSLVLLIALHYAMYDAPSSQLNSLLTPRRFALSSTVYVAATRVGIKVAALRRPYMAGFA